MATTDQQWARQPISGADITVKNTHATIAIAAGDLVTLDAAHAMSLTQPVPGVVQSTTDDVVFGVALEAMAVGVTGKCAIHGIIQVVASAAITAGDTIQASTVGKVKTALAAKPQCGQALTAAAADTDLVYMKLGVSKNA